jgi:negative regulator of flagellin synthesis FlgM
MEINGNKSSVNLNASVKQLDLQQQQQNQRAPKAGVEGSPPTADRIELSVRSREIQHLDGLIRQVSDTRDAKVEQVRSAIESGTYNVKAEKIADKIIGGSLIDQVL